MSDAKLDVIVKLNDKISAPLKGVNSQVEKTGKMMAVAGKSAKILAAGFLAISAGAIVAGKKALEAFQAQERAEARLLQIATKVTGATHDQIDAYKAQASALQRVGVVGDEVTIMGQSQLASFSKNSTTVSTLTAGLLDLAVGQYGVNVSQDQAVQSANMLGKALSGQLGALTEAGVLVSDEYAEAFKKANTEQERAAIIASVVADNYGGLNEAMRKTSEGGMLAIKNDVGDLWEDMGEKLIPVIQLLVGWMDKMVNEVIPKIVGALKEWKLAVFGNVPILEGLRLKLIEVSKKIEDKTGLISQLRDGYEKLKVKIIDQIMPAFAEFLDAIQPYIPYFEAFSKLILTGVVVALKILVDVVIIAVGWMIDFAEALMKVHTWALNTFEPAIGIMISAINLLQQPIQYIIDKFGAMKQAAQQAMDMAQTASRIVQGVQTLGLSEVARAVSGKAIGGTVSANRPYVVGEKGPELFMPSKSGAIIPNNKMGGGGLTVIVNGDVTGQDLINKVAKALTKQVGYSTAMV